MESSFSTKDLKDLFTLRNDTISDTHDKYKCDRCVHVEYSPEETENNNSANLQSAETTEAKHSGARFRAKTNVRKRSNKNVVLPTRPRPNAEQLGFPSEGDINDWSHHHGSESVDDDILRRAGRGLVTFCYGQVIGKLSLTAPSNKCLQYETVHRWRSDDGERFESCPETQERATQTCRRTSKHRGLRLQHGLSCSSVCKSCHAVTAKSGRGCRCAGYGKH